MFEFTFMERKGRWVGSGIMLQRFKGMIKAVVMNPSNEPDDFETVMAVRHRCGPRTPCSNDGMAKHI
jgi:hypothetical protein